MTFARLLVGTALAAATAAGCWITYGALGLPYDLVWQLSTLMGAMVWVVLGASALRRHADGALPMWQQALKAKVIYEPRHRVGTEPVRALPAPEPVPALAASAYLVPEVIDLRTPEPVSQDAQRETVEV